MENIAIISSSKDAAGANTRSSLIELFGFESIGEKFDDADVMQFNKIEGKKIRLYLINEDLIFAENIDKRISADIYIFASKHRSKENTPSFAVHSIGNWRKAEFGGKEKALCPCSAILLKNLYLSLMQNSHFFGKSADFELTMEATHHGPYMEKPAVFVEIGSTEKEWNDKQNGDVIAKTIMGALERERENQNYESCVVLGGTHYTQAGNKAMGRTNYAVGHVCPKYALEHLDEEMLLQAISKTIPNPKIVLLDWKGLGKEKQKILNLLKNIKMEFKRIDKI